MGWILAAILGVLLYRAHKKRGVGGSPEPGASLRPQGEREALDSARALLALRRRLRAMLERGELEDDQFLTLTLAIADVWQDRFKDLLPVEDRELSQRASEWAWNMLTARGVVPYGPPPWQQARSESPQAAGAADSPPAELVPATESPVVASVSPQVAGLGSPVDVPPVAPEPTASFPAAGQIPPAPPIPQASPVPAAAAVPPSSAVPPPVAVPPPPAQVSAPLANAPQPQPAAAPPATTGARTGAEDFAQVSEPSAPRKAPAEAWEPVGPGPIERALAVVSGWPRLLIPFLVQNIGWFIGGFMFLAGSVFLVTYTTGFTKAAIVSASLFGYTMFLIWAGYKMLTRPEQLRTASVVLLTTGLGLVPLTLSALSRLLLSAGNSILLSIVGFAATAVCVGMFYYAAKLVAGVVHRSLSGGYPRLFLALAAVQLAAPLIARWPAWLPLALAHALILGLLAYGLVRFGSEWLQSIFVAKKRSTYFAAGSLVYAAIVSFVHLTWGVADLDLPSGYFGVLLMALCGVLFYLDAQFKEHAHRHVYLSRFSFFVYALSVVAVLMSLDAPVARLTTLALGAVLYCAVVRKYLTLTPLYLALACIAGVYAFAVLAPIPAGAWFLASLPAFAGLRAFAAWALARGRKRSPEEATGLRRIGVVVYRAVLLVSLGLAISSLVFSQPGLLALSTTLVLAACAWWLLRAAPAFVIAPLAGLDDWSEAADDPRGRTHNLLQSNALYAPIAALSLGAVYAPPVLNSLPLQIALVVAILSAVWAVVLLLGRRRGTRRIAVVAEVCANSALLSVIAAVALTADAALAAQFAGAAPAVAVAVFATGAAVLLALSLNLYVTWPFYGFLALVAAAGATIKHTWFAAPSVGLLELCAAGGLLVVLWWLDRQADESSTIAMHRAWRDAPARLLWLLPGAGAPPELPQLSATAVATETPSPPDGAADRDPPAVAVLEGSSV